MQGALLGTLAELIEVPEQYEAAVEAVLGGALQNVVVPGEQEAKMAIALLRREHLGRVTFLPPVSYTHLDVYKRQRLGIPRAAPAIWRKIFSFLETRCFI